MAGREFPSERVFCEEADGWAEDGPRFDEIVRLAGGVMESTINRASAEGVQPGFLPGIGCHAVGEVSQMGYD